jgi:choline kinase
MLKYHILDAKLCETIITLSDHKGKQMIRETIQKCSLQDFRTIFIVTAYQERKLAKLYNNKNIRAEKLLNEYLIFFR